jgi:large subunit ribosomal protein L5
LRAGCWGECAAIKHGGGSSILSGNGCVRIAATIFQDYTIFPEISLESSKRTMGLDISIVTSAETDDDARELLRLVGFPFRRTETVAPKATAA